ncbi:molybdopterin-dependent oxidoreductase [Candidatus Poriferisodalis sp.]|uniref:molybdopterin-dependent oxidoreductase n=1 Tax=Candidatus Poriferisodalis sp. TaxID=3101277 RepID=UPI003B01372A
MNERPASDFAPGDLAGREVAGNDLAGGGAPGGVRTTALGTHFGPFLVDARDGEVLAVRGHPADPEPSHLGDSLKHYAEHRVQRPAVRQSWLRDGPGSQTHLRGREPFVEVNWDRALDLVASELARVRERHGRSSIFGGAYGWGSAGRFGLASAQQHRFMRLLGGCTDQKGTYSSAAAEAIFPYMLGMGYHAALARQTSWSVICAHTELFVCFGGMRATNSHVTYGGQGPHHHNDWIARARDAGVQFVNVSPLRDDFAPSVGARWLPIRPGTDVALMLGVMHTLVTEGRADEAFLRTHCHGWDSLRAYLLGEGYAPPAGGPAPCGRLLAEPAWARAVDYDTPKTPAWTSQITGIRADDVVALAHEMAAKRTLVNLSLSTQRAHHGEQPYWTALALACVLGQVGVAGGGYACSFGTQGNTGAGQVRARIPGLPVPMRQPGPPTIAVSRITEMLEGPGQPFDFDGKRGRFPDVKLVYWAGGNPFHHHQDLNRLVRAWQRPETVIVHEPFWTPLARRADIVLPATTPLERNDIGGAETMLIAMSAAAAPVGEARDDYWIFSRLAERLGFGEQFTEGRTADEWLEAIYGIWQAAHPASPPYEEFVRNGCEPAPGMALMGEPRQVFLETFRSDPAAKPLRTPSGRIELWSEAIASYGYDDCPPHPAWMEPFERLGGARSDRFGLHLVTNQPAARLHSQYDHAAPSQATKVAGREPARMHPATAAARGIRHGDVVRLFNDRGACLAGAVIDEAVMEDVVQISTGAWYDPAPDGTCRAGNPNTLTADVGTSRLGQGPSAHTCLVEAERCEDAPAVESYRPPQIVAAAPSEQAAPQD